MARVLVTGMSATGKSTVTRELLGRGIDAVDLDCPEWSEYGRVADGSEEWIWRADRVARLLEAAPDRFVVSGCASNQGQFYPHFDHIVLLSAPVPVLLERLATRTTNTFGKDPEELRRILGDVETIEPLLRRRATAEIDASAPLGAVVDAIAALAGETHSTSRALPTDEAAHHPAS